jgi:hypothetical protein
MERSIMKMLITALALAALFAAPVLTTATVASAEDVYVGGQRIGSDPDPNVRLQLRRDHGSEGY